METMVWKRGKYQENWKCGKYEKNELGKYQENWKCGNLKSFKKSEIGNTGNLKEDNRNKRGSIGGGGEKPERVCNGINTTNNYINICSLCLSLALSFSPLFFCFNYLLLFSCRIISIIMLRLDQKIMKKIQNTTTSVFVLSYKQIFRFFLNILN